MKLVSAGAAGTVTGSCHLLETRGRRLLVDCGLFQGEREPLNHEPFPFDPRSLDAVLVTHGHLDHVGRLPLLVAAGYRGPIHAIGSTRAISEVLLLDSAEIQKEEHERALRKLREGRLDRSELREPLYLPGDVPNTLALFREARFDAPLDLGAGIRVRFRPAGHILGSAFLEIETPDARVVASGDLGNRESGIQADAALPGECDAVLVETTYADRAHRSREATSAEFREVVAGAVARRGMVLIPSFALERTQTVLHELRRLMAGGRIPAVPVFLDSPMAARMTRLYQECANEFVDEVAAALERGEDPFEPPTLEYTVAREASMALNDLEGPAIVIAGSGMMSGGRILHHLKHHLWKESTTLVVVGYQASGTLGRRIVDGASSVRIHGREVDVRARVATINGFSAHADRDDLLAWLSGTGPARIYMVHGEPPVMERFARELEARGREAVVVVRGRAYDLA